MLFTAEDLPLLAPIHCAVLLRSIALATLLAVLLKGIGHSSSLSSGVGDAARFHSSEFR